MKSVLFDFFGMPVYTYGIAIAIAFAFCVWHIRKLAEKEGISGNGVTDGAIVAMISAIVGARIAHVIVEWSYYGQYPGEIIKIWEGGLVFYGGLIGCFLSLPWVFWKHKIPFWQIFDCFFPSLALSHGIVRFGCFMNGCCYGKRAAWGIVMPEVDAFTRQPSQLYESAVGIVLFVVLMKVHRNRAFRGQTMLVYLMLYALSRFIIEFTRDDPRGALGPFSTSQWLAIVIMAIAAAAWPYLAKTKKMPDGPPPGEQGSVVAATPET